MRAALKYAVASGKENEVPVGAVIVKDEKIISFGQNRREQGKNALYHAEIEAIDRACKLLGGWRLWQCELFVTLEPCAMCAGAIVNARIPRVVFGAFDQKAGACGSVIDVFSSSVYHKPEVIKGVLEQECSKQLVAFFRRLRQTKSK